MANTRDLTRRRRFSDCGHTTLQIETILGRESRAAMCPLKVGGFGVDEQKRGALNGRRLVLQGSGIAQRCSR